MDEQQARREMRKRIRWVILALIVGIVLGAVLVPLRHGQRINPVITAVSILFTLLMVAGIFWIEKRMGVFDYTHLQETARIPGESRLQWYRRLYTAEPRHRKVYRILIICGAGLVASSALMFAFNRWQAIGVLALGIGTLSMGCAEYLPHGHRQDAALMRIVGLLATIIGLPFLYWGLLH